MGRTEIISWSFAVLAQLPALSEEGEKGKTGDRGVPTALILSVLSQPKSLK